MHYFKHTVFLQKSSCSKDISSFVTNYDVSLVAAKYLLED